MKEFRTILSLLFTFMFLVMGMVSQSFAESAIVLPKGVFGVSMEGRYYFPFEKRYNDDGKKEDIAVDYNGNLNSSIFPGLRSVETFFGMRPGSASIGWSNVSYEFQGEDFIPIFQYGITDRLTMGIKTPYYWRKNNVEASLDSSTATVGKNAFLNTLTPLFVPGTVRLTTTDAQNLIGNGLDINGDGRIDISGYGFKPIKTWSGKGIGDIEIGGRYQYLKTDNWRLAFTGGIRLPTGEIDDPDNLADIGIGDGAYALLFNSNNDYTGIKNLLLNVSFRYDLILPHKERLRVPDDVDHPLTRNEENVDRDIGDIIGLEASGTYEFFNGFNFSLLYKFNYKSKNDVSGDRGFRYESLENETNFIEHAAIVGLGYSTLALFQAKKFPIPMTATFLYRNRFEGKNLLDSQYIGLNLAVYF